MLSDADRFAASEMLAKAERERVPVPRLTDTYPSIEVEDAYAIQLLQIEQKAFVLAIGRDVTGDVTAARSPITLLQKHPPLVERLPDAIWTCTASGQLTFVTPTVAGICGYSAEEMIAGSGQGGREHVHPDDVGAVRARFTADVMARETVALLQKYVSRATPALPAATPT